MHRADKKGEFSEKTVQKINRDQLVKICPAINQAYIGNCDLIIRNVPPSGETM